MAATSYDAESAAAYRASRELPREGLTAWREAVAEEAGLAPGMTVVDVGAGTGAFAAAFHDWFGVRVLAVEPAPAMRALIAPVSGGVEPVDGRAEALPLPDACADAAWLGSVVHHLADLDKAARELRRVLVPGAPVLVRNTFPGRSQDDLRVRFFPETAEGVDGYPTVERVTAAFESVGFRRTALRSLPQQSASTLGVFADRLSRDADSKLRALSDEAYARGLARLRAAAAEHPAEPAVSWMDLLVLR
ncbi:class I SAM-dependent methyltransferase [Streptacidiphilus jiangxiensis]|uniref:Methyltransferase domain-containing protein n=1 Tax=Streptacidiphilus jiangxiensis TaxID=235985 RepID=A0A1H7WTJ4_STRJI|nr:class I SAM-dependent methyltransferase [Streptacidiphilus jiangxiensis]SEM24900.1 Methyltransferase domain-containing protein [Streptacidiphilus jiangxiensis]